MLMGGAPRSTGKDEERMLRAMRAVLDVNSPLPLRIGVNWGRIFVGDFGPPYRRAYRVFGAPLTSRYSLDHSHLGTLAST